MDPDAPTTTLRSGAALMLTGVVAEYIVTEFHPSHAVPNDHHAAFAEYSASANWIAVHLAQFLAGLLLLAGMLALFHALRRAGARHLLVRAGEAAAVTTAAVFAVLQAVDGVALKHAVDSLATTPTTLQAAAFHDAETVRWMEWAMAGYFRITLGLSVAAVGVAVLGTRRRALPRWTGSVAVLSAAAFLVDGINVSYDGFTGPSLPNLMSWILLALFSMTATVAAYRQEAPAAGDRAHRRRLLSR